MVQHLSALFKPTLTMLTPDPVAASAHARNQLSAAVEENVWCQAQASLQSPVSPTEARPSLPARLKSAEDAIDSIYAACTSRLAGCSATGQGHAMQSLYAVHSCCTAFMHLSTSTQLVPSGAPRQPGQQPLWSRLMANAQRQQQPGWSAQTCWPHIMRLPLQSSRSLPARAACSDTDLGTVQALLQQACTLLMDTPPGSGFQHSLHSRLLDLILLHVWPHIPASAGHVTDQLAVAGAAVAAGEQESARRLAGLLPTLAKLLSHVVEMAAQHVTLALEQQLEEASQLDKVDELRAVRSMGLAHEQVWLPSLVSHLQATLACRLLLFIQTRQVVHPVIFMLLPCLNSTSIEVAQLHMFCQCFHRCNSSVEA